MSGVQVLWVGWDCRYRQYHMEGLSCGQPRSLLCLDCWGCEQRVVHFLNSMYSAIESQKFPSLRTFTETSFIFPLRADCCDLFGVCCRMCLLACLFLIHFSMVLP